MDLAQTLRKEFPSVIIDDSKKNLIRVRIFDFWCTLARFDVDNDKWTVREDLKSILPNFVLFKRLQQELLADDPSCRGSYLLVNDESQRFVYETFDAAWKDKAPCGFVGKIGTEDTIDTTKDPTDVDFH
jgi:hypothetical protein